MRIPSILFVIVGPVLVDGNLTTFSHIDFYDETMAVPKSIE